MLPNLWAAALFVAALPTASAQPLHRYWPEFPRPKSLIQAAKVDGRDEAFVIQSAAGLAARAARRGENREYVLIEVDRPASRRNLQEVLADARIELEVLPDVWSVVGRLQKRNIVRGYVLYRADKHARDVYTDGPFEPSANVATTLAGRLGAVLVSEELEPAAQARGLRKLGDARGVSETVSLRDHAKGCSKTMVATLDPKTEVGRAEAIALDLFVCAGKGEVYEKALARLRPDSAVFGWGMGDEYRFTETSTRWGAFQTASNWVGNLALQASVRTQPEELAPQRPRTVWDLEWKEGVHYAAFLMSDGDNLQWLTGGFLDSGVWWDSPYRGRFPMGWTFCGVDLAQASPGTLRHLRRTAAEGDDLVLMSGGYYYPDLYGVERPGVDSLSLHGQRLSPYLRQQKLAAFACLTARWDSPAALDAYRRLVRSAPEIEGFLALQYAPYHAGLGRILWTGNTPVVSARLLMWDGLDLPNCGGPDQIADWLNVQAPLASAGTQAGFSLVSVHAWSSFAVEAGRPKMPAMEAVARTVDRLSDRVEVVTPTDLVRLAALRIRPAETLAAWFAAGSGQARSRESKARWAEARRLLAAGAFRQAFEAGKAAYGTSR